MNRRAGILSFKLNAVTRSSQATNTPRMNTQLNMIATAWRIAAAQLSLSSTVNNRDVKTRLCIAIHTLVRFKCCFNLIKVIQQCIHVFVHWSKCNTHHHIAVIQSKLKQPKKFSEIRQRIPFIFVSGRLGRN